MCYKMEQLNQGYGQEVVLIGYGSLMSGTGLLRSGRLRVKRAERVSLGNCRRGFAKYAQRGDRYALDIEFLDRAKPIVAAITRRGSQTESVEGLALWVRGIDLESVVEREGYSAAAFHKLLRLSREGRFSLAELLWDEYQKADFNLVSYRSKLYGLTGYTSPHYIPQPVPLGNGLHGVLFLAPTCRATGASHVISVRERTGVTRAMTLAEAWVRKPNQGQMEYFISCLLGGIHGINVGDLIRGLDGDPALEELLAAGLAIQAREEVPRFLRATKLSPEAYREVFGTLEENLARGGLSHLFKGTQPLVPG